MAEIKDVSMYDPELGAIFSQIPPFPPFSKEVLPALRGALAMSAEIVLTACPKLSHREVTIDGVDNNKLIISIFESKAGSASPVGKVNRPGIFHIHGGGMILMDRFAGIESLQPIILDNDAVICSIEYRLVPEAASPAQLNDCYAGLKWMFAHAKDLGLDKNRIMIAGASAGGNLAAGVALMAKDKGEVRLCGEIIMCPMLDPKSSSGSTEAYAKSGMWLKDQNIIAWEWYLNGAKPNKYTAPSLATNEDVKGLPTTYIDCAALEIFRDEDFEFAQKLLAAGVPVEFHCWPGAYHAFDLLAPQAALSRHSSEVRAKWAKKVFDEAANKASAQL